MKWSSHYLIPFSNNYLYCQSSLTSNILSHAGPGGFAAGASAESASVLGPVTVQARSER